MYAAQQGDVRRVKRIVREEPVTLFDRDRTGKSSLHYCSTSGHIRAAQAADYMVMAAPDLVDSRDEDGFTPLHLAVIAGNMQLVTFLLANNADVNAVDNEKHTVVHWATVCGETAALRAVLAAGAPVSTPDVHGGYPLHYAAQMCGGDRESSLGLQVLQALLAHSDMQIAVTDGDKRQPLLWAASAGSARAVLALIRAGAAVEAADKDGLTALHCAASRGHTDCMDTLLTLCGASPDIIDSNGCTALHYAVTLGHADATALLLAHGSDPNRQDRKGRTPAHCGCAKGQFETVKLIGAHGANLWLRNARGDLPLHDAAASGRRELVKFLLEMRPSQVNSRNNDGRCPLHMAALNDNADMCKILLDAGAHINPILRTSKNVFMTPLDCSLQRGFRSTAKFLQLHGGVPATRIGDQKSQYVNLQIRDDITFWGDTSSESEHENGDVEKIGKRLYRKKLSQKFERKRSSVSSSERESKVKRDKLENTSKLKSGDKSKHKVSSSRFEGTTSSKRDDSNKLPSSTRVDYNNEIVINGRTEINIHEIKDIIIDKEGKPVQDIDLNTSVSIEKERRPRSAKYSKLRDRSAKSSADVSNAKVTRSTVISPDTLLEKTETKRNLSLKDKSTNTSEETVVTVVPNKNITNIASKDATENFNIRGENNIGKERQLPDQQSTYSYTSEDIEELKKDIVVEASVHAPASLPKELDAVTQVQSQLECDHPERPTEDLEQKKESTIIFSEETDELTSIVKEVADPRVEKQLPDLEKSSTESAEHIQNQSTNELDVENEKLLTEESKVQPANDLNKEQNQGILKIQLSEAKNKTESVKDATDVKVNDDSEINHKTHVEDDTKQKQSAAETEDKENKEDEKELQVVGRKASGTVGTENISDSEKQLIETAADQEVVASTGTEIAQKEEDNVVKPQEINENGTVIQKSGDTNDKETTIDDKNIDDQNISPSKTKSMQDKVETDTKRRRKVDSRTKAPLHEKTESKMGSQQRQKRLKKAEEASSESEDLAEKVHKSFRVLNEEEAEELEKNVSKRAKERSNLKKERSRSDETKSSSKEKHDRVMKSKIPTPLFKSTLSKSDRYLDKFHKDNKASTNLDARVPSLPNIRDEKYRSKEPPRSESNMSAPLLASLYSDNERDSISDPEDARKLGKSKKLVKRRSRTRESKSAGSDYESSNLIDSGFEPSPRSTRIPRWKNVSSRGVNMTSVTQNIQTNIRRYHLERKIFQHLLELKRNQIRANQHNEAVLVKRAIDDYHRSCASTVGAGKYIAEDYTFKSFEKFLYEALRKLQKNGMDYMKGLPETSNPLLCTRSTNRCMHATHAYTGVPCAAYLPKMDHHAIPKIGFNSVDCKPGTGGFLPNINSKKSVTLELSHGTDKQIISLPTNRLDQNKRYYVTFTVKGHEASHEDDSNNNNSGAHRHAKSD